MDLHQSYMDEFRNATRNSVIVVVTLHCSRVLPDPGWVSEFSLLLHEHDILQIWILTLMCRVSWTGLSFGILLVRIEGRMLENYSRVPDEALESAFTVPMSMTLLPRRFFLTAQGLFSVMKQRIGWRQIRPDNLMRGWEIGGQPEHLDDDDELLNKDQERTRECPEGSDLEDEHDEVWRNWQVDDREPDSWDEWNDDGGQVTTHALLLYCEEAEVINEANNASDKNAGFSNDIESNTGQVFEKTEEYVAVRRNKNESLNMERR